MVPHEAELEKARATADRVVRLALADAHFREELKAHPQATLEKAGLSAKVAEDAARELVVDGHASVVKCSYTCFLTCVFTCEVTDKL